MNAAGSSPPSSLRSAHRALTRSRIQDAARDLFSSRGFGRATMDEVAQAAGVSRSTLYLHYRDKEAILAWIAGDYADGLCAVVARLPGPMPSRADIVRWVGELAAFIASERVPTVVIRDLSDRGDNPDAVRAVGDRLMAALARQLPSFARALERPDTHALALAWAMVAMREVGWACLEWSRSGADAIGEALLVVAADIFEQFVRTQKELEQR